MILINERLNYAGSMGNDHVRLFTGNPIVRKGDGGLVMGRGAARQVRDLYPGIDVEFGERMPTTHRLTFVRRGEDRFGWFQVKHHWAEPADLQLIRESAELLRMVAVLHPHVTFHLNAPGVGNGQLKWEDVQPLLFTLPNNVKVYL